MLKKFIIPLVIIVLAIVFFKLMLTSREKSQVIEINEHIWRVEQSIVTKENLSPAITLYGRVESSELLNAASPGASVVDKVLIKEGERVSKGQLMLSLDRNDFQPLLQQAEAKVKELEALLNSEHLRYRVDQDSLKTEKTLLKLSEKALARTIKVKRQNLGSIAETEQAMKQVELQRLSFNKTQFSVQEHPARMEQLQARLTQAKADQRKMSLAVERSQIIAPFDGVVAKVNVARGDRVSLNEKLLSFYSTERLEIRAKLPVNVLAEIQQGIRRGHQLKGFASNGSQQVSLQLERLSGEAQASGVDAIFTILDKQVFFRMGTIVVLRLARAKRPDMIKVPYQVMYGNERLYQIKDQRLLAVKVRTIGENFSAADGLRQNSKSELLISSDALKNGDTILATHLPNAFTGLKVDIISPESEQ